MRIVQCAEELPDDPTLLGERQRGPFTPEYAARASVDGLHHDGRLSGDLTVFVDRHDIDVLQCADRSHRLPESCALLLVVCVEHLDGDDTADVRILCSIDGPHGAMAHASKHGVATDPFGI